MEERDAQLIRDMNDVHIENNGDRQEAYVKLEQLRRKGMLTDDKAQVAFYREEKYG